MPEYVDKNYGPNAYSSQPFGEWNVISNAIVNGTGGLRGSYDFFTVYEGSANIDYARSQTYSVTVTTAPTPTPTPVPAV